MTNGKQQIRYSTPVEEIMGNPPGWIVKWGISVFGFLLVLLLVGSWLIRFPYIVPGTVVITTANPPVDLTARVAGKISDIFVTDHQKVIRREILAVMESAADLQSIEWLDSAMDTLKIEDDYGAGSINLKDVWPESPSLGEIQEYYSDFRKKLQDYLRHIEIDKYGRNIKALEAEIDRIDMYITQLRVSEKLNVEKLELERSMFERDSTLFLTSTISPENYDLSKKTFVDEQLNLNMIKLEISSQEIEKAGKQNEIEILAARRVEERELLKTSVEEARSILLSKIIWWHQNYLILSPIEGFVTCSTLWGV